MPKDAFFQRFFDVLAIATQEQGGACLSVGDKLRIGFSWKIKPDYAVFYLAHTLGLYAAQGLAVDFQEGTGSAVALRALQAGALDLAILPATLAHVVQDADPEIVIAGLFQSEAPVCLLSRPSRPAAVPKQLEGKRIARLGSETGTAFPASFYQQHGIDPRKIQYVDLKSSEKIGAFLRGEVDVISVYRTNEYHVLKAMMDEPLVELDLSLFGVVMPGMCAVARSERNPREDSRVAHFIEATRRAIRIGTEDPTMLVDIACRMPGAHRDITIVEAQVRELVRSLAADGAVNAQPLAPRPESAGRVIGGWPLAAGGQ